MQGWETALDAFRAVFQRECRRNGTSWALGTRNAAAPVRRKRRIRVDQVAYEALGRASHSSVMTWNLCQGFSWPVLKSVIEDAVLVIGVEN